MHDFSETYHVVMKTVKTLKNNDVYFIGQCQSGLKLVENSRSDGSSREG